MSPHRRNDEAFLRLSYPALLSGLLLVAIGATPARAADIARSPSRYVPARGLTFYLEYDGLDAHADAWKATVAQEILNSAPAGVTFADVTRQALDRLVANVPDHRLTGADLIALDDHLARRGFTVAQYAENGKLWRVFVINDCGRKESRERVDRFLRFLLKPGEGRSLSTLARIRGRDAHVFQQPANGDGGFDFSGPQGGPTWWFEGDDLIIVKGPDGDLSERFRDFDRARKDIALRHNARISAVLDAIDGKAPNASAHPSLVAARAEGSDLVGFEANGVFFADSTTGKGLLRDQLEPLRRSAELSELEIGVALGFGQAERVRGRWGFRGKALLSDIRFEGPGPWKGVIGGLDPAGFRKDRLPPIPREVGAFCMGSFRHGPDVESVAPLRPGVKAEYEPFFAVVEQLLADDEIRRVLEDLASHLGQTWCVYGAPMRKDDKEAVPTLLIGVEDMEALDRSLGAVASRLNAYLQKQDTDKGTPKDRARRPALTLEQLPAPERGYRITSPANRVPWLTDDLRPTILLGKLFAVVAANPALARAAVAAESQAAERWNPSGESLKLFETLPAKLSFLAVGNPRDSFWPELIAGLPRSAAPFFEKFVGVPPDDAPAEKRPSGVLSLLGVGKPVDSSAQDALRSRIFPSLLAATVDDRGVRILNLHALPFGCVWIEGQSAGPRYPSPLSIQLKFGPRR